jgi:hypothetical protein
MKLFRRVFRSKRPAVVGEAARSQPAPGNVHPEATPVIEKASLSESPDEAVPAHDLDHGFEEMVDTDYDLQGKYSVTENLLDLTIHRLKNEGMMQPGERQTLINSLIATVDIADLALGVGDGSVTQDSPLRGLLLMRSFLLRSLSSLSITRTEPLGQPLDLLHHEIALVTGTGDQELDGLVAGVIRAGYRNTDQIVRQASVRVYRYEAALANKEGELSDEKNEEN